jgi:flagellar motor switch protein FliG
MAAASTTTTPDARNRAALALIALGPERASRVLRSMPEEVALELAREISRMGPLDAATARGVLVEVATEMQRESAVMRGGMDYSRELVSRAFGDSHVDALNSAARTRGAFDYLANAKADDVARVISGEPPSVIVLALAHVDPQVAALILGRLPAESKGELSLRLAQLGRVHQDLIAMVDADLRERIAPLLDQRVAQFDGIQLLAQVVNNASQELEKELLASMNARDPELASRIREALFVFDDLARLTDRAIQELLKSIDTRVLSVALKNAPTLVEEKVFKNLSERARENLREEIEFLRNIRQSEIVEARKRVVAMVRELEEKGVIQIERAGADDVA